MEPPKQSLQAEGLSVRFSLIIHDTPDSRHNVQGSEIAVSIDRFEEVEAQSRIIQ